MNNTAIQQSWWMSLIFISTYEWLIDLYQKTHACAKIEYMSEILENDNRKEARNHITEINKNDSEQNSFLTLFRYYFWSYFAKFIIKNDTAFCYFF